MLKFVILILTLATLAAHAAGPLASKRFLFRYDDGQHYQVSFTEETVRWECVKGEELGRSETDPYQAKVLAGGVHFVQWVEADGTFVALAVNLNTKTVVSAGVSGPYRWFRGGRLVALPAP